MDGNEAAAYIAHRVNEVIAIYPITPASPMGEHSDSWAANKIPNIWGRVPHVVEMQSESGAAGTVHGSLQAGALTTTFTASQGLLLMIPNMYKIAGELLPCVFHIASRTVATHALSIFGDHSDVMAARQTGFAMLASSSVQEAMDFALIAHSATLKSRIPFMHFFDGFRTSHEISKIELIEDQDIRSMIDEKCIQEHRERALSPDHPVLRGTAQNPDVFFQCREAANQFYLNCPRIVQETMNHFFSVTGRKYKLFDYFGSPDAERVIVLMGSGSKTVHETVEHLISSNHKVGVIKVRLYRPFDIDAFLKALPRSTCSIAVLDRTKEPGSVGEPLYLDIISTLEERGKELFDVKPRVIGGRYGLSSKEFTPAMVQTVFEELTKETPKNHFTLGIKDDVTLSSLDHDLDFSIEQNETIRALFYGLGADGTVGANKNTIKIIGEKTNQYVQGYFVYDSKKSGSMTISHLRFGPRPIQSSYLIQSANFIGCHQFSFLEKYDVLEKAKTGGTFLLNAPFTQETIWEKIPQNIQRQIIEKKLKFYAIDAYKVAEEANLGARINTIMQTCFFSISGILPSDQAISLIKEAIRKSYAGKNEKIVEMNFQAVDHTLANLFEVEYLDSINGYQVQPPIPKHAPDFVKRITALIVSGKGDSLPVSAFPPDGTWPIGTSQWEKRNIAQSIPIWDKDICIQCNKCAMVCPHAAIRVKAYEPDQLKNSPTAFQHNDYRGVEYQGMKYTVQVAPEDCTGCGVCVDVCPAKDKSQPKFKAINMRPHQDHANTEIENYKFFLNLPDPDRSTIHTDSVKGPQFMRPLFEYSGACSGCGETPYLKLLSQLFGDRLMIANATGCSSIYGGNLPTTPWTTNADGRGPAWANSLFEDNAEFGLGFRLAVDFLKEKAVFNLGNFASQFGQSKVQQILESPQSSEKDFYNQRLRVEELKVFLKNKTDPSAEALLDLADYLVKKSVWIVGGDGWGYDIGFGGLDHVLSTGKDVNILVLDTMVYSNTGGQMSKGTPLGAVAKFAAAGKETPMKNLGVLAMSYGNVYVAQVAMGSKDIQTVKAFNEAEKFPGPSLIIAYSQCIAHGINMTLGMQHQKSAVDCGFWPLYRYNPESLSKGENPLHLDSKAPKINFKDFAQMETRFSILKHLNPERSKQLLSAAQHEIDRQWKYLENLAAMNSPAKDNN